MLKICLAGRWPPGSVVTRWVPSTRRETPASRAAIDSSWASVGADPRIRLFDGPMCRLEAVETTPAGLRLDLSLTSYKVFLGTNLYGPRDLPRESLANPLGVSPALETGDGFLLFGRRNGSVAYYPHRIHPFSGALEPPPARASAPADPAPAGAGLDVFAECRRELAEELNLSADDVPSVALLGIVEDETIRHPELILHARTSLSRDAVTARLDGAEHDALHAVPATRAGVEAALREDAFTPVALAALELFLRTGQERRPC